MLPTDESTHASARFLDLGPASVANVLASADPQPLGAFSSQSGKRWCHCIQDPDEGNYRPQTLFFEHSARRPEVVADLPVAMDPSPSSTADAVLHDSTFLRRPSLARLGSPRYANSASTAAPRVPRLTAALSLDFDRPGHMKPHV